MCVYKPLYFIHTLECVCVCVRYSSIQTGNCCSYQWPASSFGEGGGGQGEGGREGGDAWLLCCPLSPEFWQPIRGEQIRPHTCFMFGELAVSCSETDAEALWEEWTSHFPSPVILHFLYGRMLIYTGAAAAAASNLYE